LSETWFVSLFRNLVNGVRKSERERVFENVSFVVFNYDRCIDHFFYTALQDHYGISELEAKLVIDKLRIYHPYGTIGPLEWQSPKDGIPFGFAPNRANLMAMVSNIKTYQVKDLNLMNNIHNEVRQADTIVFLGFSHHHENMKLLSPGVVCKANSVLGTALGISHWDHGEVLNSIWNLIRPMAPQTADMKIQNDQRCADLLREFSRSLFR
jgi:hypothetical protein